jgi:hypothetical protein
MGRSMPTTGSLIACILVSVASYYWLAYQLEREYFNELLLCFFLSFMGYYYLIRKAKTEPLPLFLFLGFLFRCIFLFSTPSLSDDYFRFIWDGQLMHSGISPFAFIPDAYEGDFPNKEILLENMNSPSYYSVYPPMSQLVYFLGTYMSPNSIFGNIISLRIILLLAETGTILLLPRLLQKLHLAPINSLWYILNPLVIVELSGNLHLEGIVIFFLLLALFLFFSHKRYLSSIPWTFAAATKLIPLLLLPIFFHRLGLRKTLIYLLLCSTLFLSLWIPFYAPETLPHFWESIRLYSGTFEFNASIYYIVRWIGFQYTGYNIIATAGSFLSIFTLLGMLFLLLRTSSKNTPSFFSNLLLALSLYYALALIVHPWYLSLLVFFSVFTPYRYAILWSALSILSYWTYSNSNFQENTFLLLLEYLGVFSLFSWEILLKRKNFYL